MKNHRASVETFLSVSPILCHYICFARSHVPITPSRSMYGNCSVLSLRAGTDRFTIEAGGPSPRLSPVCHNNHGCSAKFTLKQTFGINAIFRWYRALWGIRRKSGTRSIDRWVISLKGMGFASVYIKHNIFSHQNENIQLGERPIPTLKVFK